MVASTTWSVALLLSAVVAHPNHDASQEMAERRSFLNSVRSTSLAHCAESLRARGVDARNAARRSSLAQEARFKRGLLDKRDAETVLGKSHNQTELGYSQNTDLATLFSGNNSCVLAPEVTEGPYYVSGEHVRRNVVDGQKGIDIVLDYQVIDVDTCKPVPNVYVEIWHCNSTGVYSGVVANGNGNAADQPNLSATFLRGIQETNSEGVVSFESLFPGHYGGRTTHIHVMVHANATLYQNQTLGYETYASHVGQAFFDQSLISGVELLEPYRSNEQALTTNAEDMILSQEADADGVDPLMQYALLGDSVSDGLLAWIAFGINTSFASEVTAASFLYDSGGVENPNSGNGGRASSSASASASEALGPTKYASDLAAMACFLGLAVFF
ncbi:dioxygenase [Hirsutella rhossiliensis]|uniref:Dioxygenase domain-containing protein n=1 Tax=Hirsutella rhossiliensis TaxID=111463 RepID=A0A9P8MPV3_9HYPO|nr:dioxygenase domain-containing protein [Hirsutella rhossiliensis]KAH0960088.1 dioxygenase domain-containing protein [Hirsutella rhossiliensis]